ncbi:hypothetical protein AVEN_236093-1 [Araneus ventricosus]|uniref:Uncharacterized protein n=1 Tax=Araneus ventricosus TaxID=182803 RepID=A0A4Y2QYD7_ARAVE|nr:hypothetical protein AVEN_236093-1 [Araneus ventricosus]
MHSVADCFHSNQPSLSILFPRRNLSAATKHGDLTDRTPSACKRNILSLSPSPSHPKHLSLTLERGVRIRTGTPSPNGVSESSASNGFLPFSRFVPFGRTRALSFLLRIRIFKFVPE